MSKINETGHFVPTDIATLNEAINALKPVAEFQKKYNVKDTDKLINEIRDSITGTYLGFWLKNESKNGFDCRSRYGRNLEVKSINMSAHSWGATFNDTTLDKAYTFMQTDTVLVAGLWDSATDLRFIVVGNNPCVGAFLWDKVKAYLEKRMAIRCTQTISIRNLIEKYHFDVIAIGATPDETYKILTDKYKGLNLRREDVLTLEEADCENPFDDVA